MGAFAEAYPDRDFVQQVVARLPWDHNLLSGDAKAPRADGPCLLAGKETLIVGTLLPLPCKVFSMLSCWHIALRAEDPAANRYRAYDIRIDRDLFALWTITVSWGRIGAAGTRKTMTVTSLDDAWRLLRPMLRRRLTARRRIGCLYRLVSCHLPESCGLEDVVQEFTGTVEGSGTSMTPM